MSPRRPLLRRLLMISTLALLGGIAPAATTATPPTAAPSESATAASFEARLRKLHLVRPDLIAYPFFADVIC